MSTAREFDKSDYPIERDETNTRRGLRGVLLTPKRFGVFAIPLVRFTPCETLYFREATQQ
jgi:hypothetical protein